MQLLIKELPSCAHGFVLQLTIRVARLQNETVPPNFFKSTQKNGLKKAKKDLKTNPKSSEPFAIGPVQCR